MLAIAFLADTALACTCTAYGDQVLLSPGETKSFTVGLRNEDEVNTCWYEVRAWSNTLDDIVNSATGQPLTASGYIGPGATIEFSLSATAPFNANANAVSFPLASGGTEFEYRFINDGEGYCAVDVGACVLPSAETSDFVNWTDISGTGPGPLAGFQVTVDGGSGTFHGRAVREIFTPNWFDSCFYFGSFYDEIEPPALLGQWHVSPSSNVLVDPQGIGSGHDVVGVIDEVILWYQGDQANMTSEQLTAIASGTPAPPNLTTNLPYRCTVFWEQRMRMWCEHPAGPTGFQGYLDQPMVIDIVGWPLRSVEVTRGMSGVQTLSYP